MKKIISLLLILSIFLYGCVSDPERLAPKEDLKTGLANYLTVPFDVTELSGEGYVLERGWNVFIWPRGSFYDNIDAEDLLGSIEDDYLYAYSYNEDSFYFPLEGKYAQLRGHKYYSARLFDTFKSGQKYSIYLSKEGVLKPT